MSIILKIKEIFLVQELRWIKEEKQSFLLDNDTELMDLVKQGHGGQTYTH